VTEGESVLTERVQCQGGNRHLQGSEGVRAIRSRSDGGRGPRGSEGVRTVRSRSDGGNQTEGVEWLWAALTSGPGCQVCVREAVSRGPGRSICIGRRGSDRGNRRLRALPLLSTAVRSPEFSQARTTVAPGSPELG
jgi:hypothetical protein